MRVPDEPTSSIVNRQQFDAWNGFEGEHWARHADRYDAMLNGGANEALFDAAALGPDECVLDIGCGTGATTILAAREARTGQVLGIDLSAAMLERARSDAAAHKLTNVTFIQGDAQVHPFLAGSVDVVISRAAMNLFTDPVAAFTNIRGALRSGGRLAFLTPQASDPDSDLARAADVLRPLLSKSSPAQQGMDTTLTEPTRLHEVLTESGFTEVIVTNVPVWVCVGHSADEAADFLLSTGPFRVNLDELDPEDFRRLRNETRDGMKQLETPTGVHVRKAQWLVTATPTTTGNRSEAS